MKKVLLTLMCVAAMMEVGTGLKAQEVTITIMPGCNWISVPLMDTLDFQTALGSFIPEQGDIIKSKWNNAHYRNGQWVGRITQFYPGYGYMYISKRTMPVLLTFNAQQPTPQVVVTTSEPTDITTNSATCGGNVASSNGDYVSVTLRGICWSTSPNPTFNDNYIEAGNGLGSFTVSMTELTLGATYYVRAFAVTQTGTFYGDEVSFATLCPVGAINGKFTINDNGDQVYFSQGNLQYQASTNIWRFAENQWDYVGEDNANISQTYDGWIDLFGWGTSGYNHGAVCYQPWSTSQTSSDYYAYGSSTYNLSDQTGQADWGYNPISNSDNQENQWRTLTNAEWRYIFNTRETTSNIRYVKAMVNDVNGVILLPDNWNSAYYSLCNTNTIYASFNSNVITASQWNTLESHGAVFLPAAGYRDGTWACNVGSVGEYWSGSYYNSISAYNVYFHSSWDYGHARYAGRSVRLVRVTE